METNTPTVTTNTDITAETATAYHEAGHAIAALILDLPFEAVSIVPDDESGSSGRVNYGYAQWMLNIDRREFRAEIRDNLAMTIAGPIAEMQLTGVRNDDGASSDDEHVFDILRLIYGDRAQRHQTDLTRQARRIVSEHWAAIERLALALIQRKTLTATEATAIAAVGGL